MSIVELRPRRSGPRVFVEAPADTAERIKRALAALGDLPDGFDDLPGLDDLSEALIAIADALEPDCDLEDNADDEVVTEDDLPLFAHATARPNT